MTKEIWTICFARAQTVSANQKEYTALMGDHMYHCTLCLPQAPPHLCFLGECNFVIVYLKFPAIFTISPFLLSPLWVNLFIKSQKWLNSQSAVKGKN